MKQILLILGLVLSVLPTNGQKTNKSTFDISTALVSRYVWRGVEFGNSPAIQPSLTYNNRGLSVGAWGNYSFNTNTRGTELDLFAAYEFDFGLKLSITDYYFPIEITKITGKTAIETGAFIGEMTDERTGDYFDYKNNHFFEVGLNQRLNKLSLSANYFFSANMSQDFYCEACYDLKLCTLFMGGGNKSYTNKGQFDIVNIGISATKQMQLSETYSLPLFAAVILNPNVNQLHFVAGINL
ncbi:TorF family putative porin [Carboxylicivirga taeanensis]|uniref:TorF family putative porin n=1 Tax=Carboxylicivirga taeanensis TaxID=1416875 RepID=UPI003F6DB1D1